MKRIIYISFLAVFMSSCGSNKSEIEKIEVEIPVALQSNSEAKELIEETSMTISAISDELAYAHHSHFARAFLRDVGCSPITYRRKSLRASALT